MKYRIETQKPNIKNTRFGHQGACGKQQRIARQKGRYHQTRFTKNNQRQNKIGLPLVLGQ